jgi:hypothetical protein
VAGQRRPVPPEQLDGVALAHPRPEPEQQLADAFRGPAGGVLERRQLLDLVDRPQAVRGADQQVAGVLDHPGGRHPSQLVDEERGSLDRGPVPVDLPGDDPDPARPADALVGQDLGERP